MARTRDVSVSDSREPTIMIVFIFRFQISDFRFQNNGDRINISQGDNIRHGEVVPGHKHDLIDKEVTSNNFF